MRFMSKRRRGRSCNDVTILKAVELVRKWDSYMWFCKLI